MRCHEERSVIAATLLGTRCANLFAMYIYVHICDVTISFYTNTQGVSYCRGPFWGEGFWVLQITRRSFSGFRIKFSTRSLFFLLAPWMRAATQCRGSLASKPEKGLSGRTCHTTSTCTNIYYILYIYICENIEMRLRAQGSESAGLKTSEFQIGEQPALPRTAR